MATFDNPTMGVVKWIRRLISLYCCCWLDFCFWKSELQCLLRPAAYDFNFYKTIHIVFRYVVVTRNHTPAKYVIIYYLLVLHIRRRSCAFVQPTVKTASSAYYLMSFNSYETVVLLRIQHIRTKQKWFRHCSSRILRLSCSSFSLYFHCHRDRRQT